MRIFGNKSKLAALAVAPVLVLVLMLAGGVFINHAVAGPSAGNSNNAYAVGGFTVMTTFEHVAFAAHQNPKSPTAWTGHVVQDTATGSRSGPVFCVAVDTSGMYPKARVIWEVKQSDFNDVGAIRQFDVTDRGEPVMGVPPDLYTDRLECALGGDCDCLAGDGFNPLLHGNIVVKGPTP
jgi:hypothetical protein